MATIPEILATAIEHHRAGNLQGRGATLPGESSRSSPIMPRFGICSAWSTLRRAGATKGRRCFRRAVACSPTGPRPFTIWVQALGARESRKRRSPVLGGGGLFKPGYVEAPTMPWAWPFRNKASWTKPWPAIAGPSGLIPQYAAAHNDLGIVLAAQGNLTNAVALVPPRPRTEAGLHRVRQPGARRWPTKAWRTRPLPATAGPCN